MSAPVYSDELTEQRLSEEYFRFAPRETPLRFGQMIVNKYLVAGPDSAVFHETNNGAAYKLLLSRIMLQAQQRIQPVEVTDEDDDNGE